MRGARRVAGVVLVVAAVGAGLGFGLSPGASADDPGVCGYVGYGTEPTSTVPSIPRCEWPCPSGVGARVPPGHVENVHWAAVVCLTGV